MGKNITVYFLVLIIKRYCGHLLITNQNETFAPLQEMIWLLQMEI